MMEELLLCGWMSIFQTSTNLSTVEACLLWRSLLSVDRVQSKPSREYKLTERDEGGPTPRYTTEKNGCFHVVQILGCSPPHLANSPGWTELMCGQLNAYSCSNLSWPCQNALKVSQQGPAVASNLRVYPCPHDSGVRQRRRGSLRWWWDRAAGQGHYVSQRHLVREDNQDCRIVGPVPIRHVLAVLGRRAEPDGGLHRLVSFSSLHFALHRLVSFSSLHFAGKIIAPFFRKTERRHRIIIVGSS